MYVLSPYASWPEIPKKHAVYRTLFRHRFHVLIGCFLLLGSGLAGVQLTNQAEASQSILLWFCILVCSVTDLFWKRILNSVLAATFLCALLLIIKSSILAIPCGMPESKYAMLGACGCFAIMLLMHLLFGGGAGDVKLAGVLGLLLGFESGVNSILLGYVIAGIVAIPLLAGRSFGWRQGLFAHGTLPMAPFFLLGVAMTN